MYEIAEVRQDDPALKFRWFTNENATLDLFIWETRERQEIVRFQFYFDRQQEEKVIEWKGSRSLWYARVDYGIAIGLGKASPVLMRQDGIDLHDAFSIFQAYARELDQRVRNFVAARFQEKLN